MAEADYSAGVDEPTLFSYFSPERKSELDASGNRWRRSELPGTVPAYELPAEAPLNLSINPQDNENLSVRTRPHKGVT